MLLLFLGKTLLIKCSHILVSENHMTAKFLCVWILCSEFLSLSMPWNSVLNFRVFLLYSKTYAHILWISRWKVLIPEEVYNEIFIVYYWYISANHGRRWKDGGETHIFVLVFLLAGFISDIEGISCWILNNSKLFWFWGTHKFIWKYINILCIKFNVGIR